MEDQLDFHTVAPQATQIQPQGHIVEQLLRRIWVIIPSPPHHP